MCFFNDLFLEGEDEVWCISVGWDWGRFCRSGSIVLPIVTQAAVALLLLQITHTESSCSWVKVSPAIPTHGHSTRNQAIRKLRALTISIIISWFLFGNNQIGNEFVFVLYIFLRMVTIRCSENVLNDWCCIEILRKGKMKNIIIKDCTEDCISCNLRMGTFILFSLLGYMHYDGMDKTRVRLTSHLGWRFQETMSFFVLLSRLGIRMKFHLDDISQWTDLLSTDLMLLSSISSLWHLLF